jgi:hypothetical protein
MCEEPIIETGQKARGSTSEGKRREVWWLIIVREVYGGGGNRKRGRGFVGNSGVRSRGTDAGRDRKQMEVEDDPDRRQWSSSRERQGM